MKLHFLTYIFLLFNGIIVAQKLSGITLDESQNPIQEVTILNKNTDQHIHTDKKGQFLFENITIGDTLQFNHISYKTKTFIVTQSKTPLHIVLTSNTINLNEVVIASKINALQILSDIGIQISPVNSSQDILQKVPGLFIGQHAGGGKAEQIFLRGFDIDHGTDINITVDGLPINMVSHAHGQGYADLHFIIPETVNKINFKKVLMMPIKVILLQQDILNFEPNKNWTIIP